MANNVKIKRSAVHLKVPTTADLELGELAINTYDGKLYAKKNDGSDSIVELTSLDGHDSSYFVAASGDTMTGNLDFNNHKVVGLADPTSDGDAAPKSYVDALVAGLRWKQPVKAASDSNLDLDGTETIDGISCGVGDRVLAMGQTTSADNGIYVVASGAWARATDFDSLTPIDEINGAAVYVEEGTTYGDISFTVISQVNTLGTDPITFAQFNGTSNTSAGDGLTKTGSVMSVDPDGTTLTVAAAGVKISDSVMTTLNGKLNTSAYTAADVLAKIKTVDGAGSGLDADYLRGHGLFVANTGSISIPSISASNGVMEIGRYIDFHTTGSTVDYDMRLDCSSADNLEVSGGNFIVNGSTSVTGNSYVTGSLSSTGAIYEGGTSLVSKYLGISAKAADSNLLDGIDSTSFLRSNATDTASGVITFSNTSGIKSQMYDSRGSQLAICGGESASQMTTTNIGTGEIIWLGSEGGIKVVSSPDNWASAWDGRHESTLIDSSGNAYFSGTISEGGTLLSSKYLGKTAKAADSNLLDGIDSTSFLRSNATDYMNNTIYCRGYLVSETAYRDRGVYGTYDNTKTQHIWSMGTGYKNAADGSDFGNLYGLAYKYNGSAGGHGVYLVNNGSALCGLGTNLWTSHQIISSVATGTAPLVVSSTTKVVNLNADYLDGLNSASFLRSDAADTHSGTITPSSDNAINLGSSSLKYANVYATTFQGRATSANYADLAEKYSFEPDVVFEAGKVVLISENDNVDCKLSDDIASDAVLGVMSENPAFRMNDLLEDGHYVALKGRVPCYVQGPVKKGETLVSYFNGTSIGTNNELVSNVKQLPQTILGKSLEKIDDDGLHLIEIVVL